MAKADTSVEQLAEEFGLDLIDPMDSAQVEPTNAVIYGVPGSGKTGLGFTGDDPLLLDFEKGGSRTARAVLQSLKEQGIATGTARIISIDYDEGADGTPAQDAMNKLRAAYKMLRDGRHPFRTVILDPVGQLQDLIMAEVIEKYPSRRVYGNQPAMQDWGKALGDATKLLKAFRALPLHTVVMAHSEIPKSEEDDVHPLVTGKNFGPFLEGSMDLLGYLYAEEVTEGEEVTTTRILQVKGDGRVRAKNRGDKLPSHISSPNLSEIFAVMEDRT